MSFNFGKRKCMPKLHYGNSDMNNAMRDTIIDTLLREFKDC